MCRQRPYSATCRDFWTTLQVALVVSVAPFLFSVAGIAMALAGFSGLIAALRHDRQRWTEEELFLLRLLLTSAFSGVFFALIPMPVFELIGREGPTLQVASLGYVVWLTVTVMRFRAKGRSLGTRRTRQPPAGILLFASSVVLGVANIALGSTAVYEVMLLVVLGSPVVVFVSIFATLHDPPAA